MAQTDSRPMKAVVNSTPLIALSMLNHLFVLKALFDEIFGRRSQVQSSPFKVAFVLAFTNPELLGLDTGEMDVILLAREVKADLVLNALIAENIGVGVHYLPVHLYPFYRKTYHWKEGDFPNAEWIGERTVSLPLSAGLNKEDVDDVIATFRKVPKG